VYKNKNDGGGMYGGPILWGKDLRMEHAGNRKKGDRWGWQVEMVGVATHILSYEQTVIIATIRAKFEEKVGVEGAGEELNECSGGVARGNERARMYARVLRVCVEGGWEEEEKGGSRIKR
jgi:hypothetical protein